MPIIIITDQSDEVKLQHGKEKRAPVMELQPTALSRSCCHGSTFQFFKTLRFDKYSFFLCSSEIHVLTENLYSAFQKYKFSYESTHTLTHTHTCMHACTHTKRKSSVHATVFSYCIILLSCSLYVSCHSTSQLLLQAVILLLLAFKLWVSEVRTCAEAARPKHQNISKYNTVALFITGSQEWIKDHRLKENHKGEAKRTEWVSEATCAKMCSMKGT